MENRRVVVDTSIIIDFLRSHDKQKTVLFELATTASMSISVITLYELLMGAKDEKKLDDISIILNGMTILSFDKDIAYRAGEIYHQLRKNNKLIEFRDIFIGATALTYQLPISTKNIKHFSRIPELEIYEL
ncbi:MAG: type II toxin-antitoxin system VapC family toxin [Bacteroidota bacterium]